MFALTANQNRSISENKTEKKKKKANIKQYTCTGKLEIKACLVLPATEVNIGHYLGICGMRLYRKFQTISNPSSAQNSQYIMYQAAVADILCQCFLIR